LKLYIYTHTYMYIYKYSHLTSKKWNFFLSVRSFINFEEKKVKNSNEYLFLNKKKRIVREENKSIVVVGSIITITKKNTSIHK